MEASASRYPLTVAGTAADLGIAPRTAFPIKPVLPGTGAIFEGKPSPVALAAHLDLVQPLPAIDGEAHQPAADEQADDREAKAVEVRA